ncbi:MAG: EscU/YscU/HrcU family type III secretion system export apparatus switch protein [Desulfotalea sp.]
MDKKKAIALGYNQTEDTSPKVLASGQGLVAEKIIAIAEEAGIFIQEDKDLVQLLSKVEVGQEIPADLYQTVAEILAFVYRTNKDYNKK